MTAPAVPPPGEAAPQVRNGQRRRLLEVRNLRKHFPLRRGLMQRRPYLIRGARPGARHEPLL